MHSNVMGPCLVVEHDLFSTTNYEYPTRTVCYI